MAVGTANRVFVLSPMHRICGTRIWLDAEIRKPLDRTVALAVSRNSSEPASRTTEIHHRRIYS